MNLHKRFLGFLLCIIIALVVVGLGLPHQLSEATTPHQDNDLVEHGEYLANILRCTTCHTPNLEEYSAEELNEEQTRVLALFPREALNRELWLAGGRTFNFGPAGSVTASNLTAHETGLLDWTDEEIKATLQTGVSRDGRRMHGIMPTYNGLADSDLDALVAYMRTVEPIENAVANDLEVGAPPAEVPAEPIISPDASADLAARGVYLVDNMGCSGCHTPTDPETRRPIDGKYLAGRDPFERDFGTVYAGNITPHEETGIGTWTDAEIKRAMNAGVRIDGRRLSLMPWQDYSFLSPDDLDALVYFLVNEVDAVENSIPQTSLADPYVEIVTDQINGSDSDDEDDRSNLGIAVVGGLLVLLIGSAIAVMRQRQQDDKSD